MEGPNQREHVDGTPRTGVCGCVRPGLYSLTPFNGASTGSTGLNRTQQCHPWRRRDASNYQETSAGQEKAHGRII
ncbi:hypothetical protein BaRGS_00023900, partial [Batillaria attramentaria]